MELSSNKMSERVKGVRSRKTGKVEQREIGENAARGRMRGGKNGG